MAGRTAKTEEPSMLQTLYGKVQQEKARREQGRKAKLGTSLEPLYVGMPKGEIIPPSIGRGGIGGGFQKGALARGWAPSHVLSLQQCRHIARGSPLIQAIHSARLHQAYAFSARIVDEKKDPGWSVIHKDRFNPRRKIDPDWERDIAEKIEDMFLCPHPVHEPTFSGLFSKFVQDFFTTNRPTIQTLRNHQGKPVQLVMRNGVEILPTYVLQERFVDMTNADQADLIAEFEKFEAVAGMGIEEAEYVMVRDGRFVAGFRPGEILIPQFGPTTELEDFGFPPPHVERAVRGILAFGTSFEYNSSYFTRGYMADVIILLAGGYTDMAMQAIEDQMQAKYHGLEGAHTIPMVGVEDLNDAKVLQVKQGNREMEFGTWLQALVSVTCAVYRMHPSEINFTAMTGNDGPLFGHSQVTEISSAKDQGLGVMLGHAAEAFTTIVRQCHPDFRFHFWNLSPEDETATVDLRIKELTNYKSLDEIRVAAGEKPYNQPWSKIPMNPILMLYALGQQQQPGQEDPNAQPGGPGQEKPDDGQQQPGDEIPDFEGQGQEPTPGEQASAQQGKPARPEQQQRQPNQDRERQQPEPIRKGGPPSELFLLLEPGSDDGEDLRGPGVKPV